MTLPLICMPLVVFAVTAFSMPAELNHPQSVGADPTRLWAILVAGSKGYGNYRHQADICHAYHVLHNHGVPDERIVVMMYDDIAYNGQNPTPGVIVNHPQGPNVYRGVPKDYTKNLVTASNFLQILQGQEVKGGSGKVIASGPDDHIFVYFSGHGGPGLISFPNDVLTATKFVGVIERMSQQNKFAKMVVYIEACYSGSMFDQLLPNNLNVFATTAANSEENSYACYLDEFRYAFLGDEYSVKWMEDSDKRDLIKTTLNDQFELVKAETRNSHVMMYGDTSMGKIQLSKFQGSKMAEPVVLPKVPCGETLNGDVPISILRYKLAKATDTRSRMSVEKLLNKTLKSRSFLKSKIAQIVAFVSKENAAITKPLILCNREAKHSICYEDAVRHFNNRCFNLAKNPFALQSLCFFVNACQSGYTLVKMIAAMDAVCTHPNITGTV